jgi:hypothetical protein
LVREQLAGGRNVNLYRIDVRTGERQVMESPHFANRIDQAWIALDSARARVLHEPPLENKPKPISPRNALWKPAAFLTQNGRLYAYTLDGHAYAMQLN